MTSRMRLLGIALVIGGLLFVGAGGFTFVNPQAKSSCGCGTSFSA